MNEKIMIKVPTNDKTLSGLEIYGRTKARNFVHQIKELKKILSVPNKKVKVV